MGVDVFRCLPASMRLQERLKPTGRVTGPDPFLHVAPPNQRTTLGLCTFLLQYTDREVPNILPQPPKCQPRLCDGVHGSLLH